MTMIDIRRNGKKNARVNTMRGSRKFCLRRSNFDGFPFFSFFFFFLVDEGREYPSTTVSAPLSTRH